MSPVLKAFKLGLIWLLLQVAAAQNSTFDVFKYINQLIGTDNGGNVFAGATLPYGMAKAVADVDGQNTGGFSTDGSNVTGFSHMHDSGTGGVCISRSFPHLKCFTEHERILRN